LNLPYFPSSLKYEIPSDYYNIITKESIIEKTYISENLPLPLFSCLKTGKRLPKRGIPPFAKGRDLVFSVYTIMD